MIYGIMMLQQFQGQGLHDGVNLPAVLALFCSIL
jgi:hypothetical protein